MCVYLLARGGARGCSQLLDIRKRASLSTCVLAFVTMNIFFSCVNTEEGTAAPCGKCMFNVIADGPAVFESGCTTLIPRQQSAGCWLLPASHSWQQLLLWSRSDRCIEESHCGLNQCFPNYWWCFASFSFAIRISSFEERLFSSFLILIFSLRCMGS